LDEHGLQAAFSRNPLHVETAMGCCAQGDTTGRSEAEAVFAETALGQSEYASSGRNRAFVSSS